MCRWYRAHTTGHGTTEGTKQKRVPKTAARKIGIVPLFVCTLFVHSCFMCARACVGRTRAQGGRHTVAHAMLSGVVACGNARQPRHTHGRQFKHEFYRPIRVWLRNPETTTTKCLSRRQAFQAGEPAGADERATGVQTYSDLDLWIFLTAKYPGCGRQNSDRTRSKRQLYNFSPTLIIRSSSLLTYVPLHSI